ncbi:MAG: flagellar biosynthetic protein FliO [Acidobacteriaceae bacterium]
MNTVAWCRARLSGGATEASPLRLIGQLPLGGKRSLALIEADGVRFLVGGSTDSVAIIVPVIQTTYAGQQTPSNLVNFEGLSNHAEAVQSR